METISLIGLGLAFIPALAVVAILHFWADGAPTALHGLARMLLQLVLVGYVLAWIFESDSVPVVLAVLTVMLGAAGWISMRPLREQGDGSYGSALLAIGVAGGAVLLLVVFLVLQVKPWYEPRYVVPLAGMIFSGSMNAVSVGAERFESELLSGTSIANARATALRAALIPITNSLFAVGVVSLPGMMTGQILAGVSPLVAVRYQIVVMCMLFGSAGIAAAIYLALRSRRPADVA